jgi:hypothetical protein
MKRKSWAALPLAAAFCLALAAPVAAASPFIDVSQDRGSSAYTGSDSCTEDLPDVGDSTCEYKGADVSDGWSRWNGEQFRAATVCIYSGTSVFDASEGTYADIFTSGCLEGADITFGKALTSASGAGTVETESASCVWDAETGEGDCTEPVPAGDVTVDLHWTGIPPVYKSKSHGRDSDGYCTSTFNSKGTWSEATFSGTYDGDPVSFDWAQISSGKNRYTYSCHQ